MNVCTQFPLAVAIHRLLVGVILSLLLCPPSATAQIKYQGFFMPRRDSAFTGGYKIYENGDVTVFGGSKDDSVSLKASQLQFVASRLAEQDTVPAEVRTEEFFKKADGYLTLGYSLRYETWLAIGFFLFGLLPAAFVYMYRTKGSQAVGRIRARSNTVRRVLNDVTEREQRRIARDLHDGPIQELSTAHLLMLDHEAALSANPDLDFARNSVKSSINELREICERLRPGALDRFGLSAALQWLCKNGRERAPNVRWDCEIMPTMSKLTAEQETAFFRIAQEAASNAVRHADPSWVKITLKEDEHSVTLKVEDDGNGFRVPADLLDFAGRDHLGLIGMKERAEAAHISVQITSELGHGTTIEAIAVVSKDMDELKTQVPQNG